MKMTSKLRSTPPACPYCGEAMLPQKNHCGGAGTGSRRSNETWRILTALDLGGPKRKRASLYMPAYVEAIKRFRAEELSGWAVR